MNNTFRNTSLSSKSVIFSSHDLDLALQTADIIWLITKDQKIEVDSPEDLVLNGHFEKAFNKKGIKFHPQRGIFKMNRVADTKIQVKGNKLDVIWTERALERIGISTDGTEHADGSIQIEKIDGKYIAVWGFSLEPKDRKDIVVTLPYGTYLLILFVIALLIYIIFYNLENYFIHATNCQ